MNNVYEPVGNPRREVLQHLGFLYAIDSELIGGARAPHELEIRISITSILNVSICEPGAKLECAFGNTFYR